MEYRDTIETSTLDNGLIVVTNEISHTDAVSFCIATKAGTLMEDHPGLAHFYEHIMFAGTETRSRERITADFENPGGKHNAHTSQEYIQIQLNTRKKHSITGLEALIDVDQNASLPSQEIAIERKTIRAEILRDYEEAAIHVSTLADESCFKGSTLGRPILGTLKSAKTTTRQQLLDFQQNHYLASQKILVASGGITHKQTADLAAELFKNLKPAKPAESREQIYASTAIFDPRECDSIAAALSFKGVGYRHKDYPAYLLVSSMIGEGMSSRLMQELREKTGLVYDASSEITAYDEAGMFQIFLEMDAEQSMRVLPLVREILLKAGTDKKFTEEEFMRAKEQLLTENCFDGEGTPSRAQKLMSDMFCYGRIISKEETEKQIEEIELESVNRLAQKLFSSNWAYAAVGPEREIHQNHEWLSKHYRA